MKIQLGRGFWMIVTVAVMAVTAYVVVRNLLHAIQIQRQISLLKQERDRYQLKIEQDSIFLEQLRYDDYLEEYAREKYRMQRPDEQIYIVEE